MLRRTLLNLLGFSFSKINRVGARDVASDEKIAAQQLRRYVHVVEVSTAMHLEATGKAIVAYKDESFCNTSHTGNFSLVPTDAAGRPQADSRMPTGAGELLCVTGMLTNFGSIAARDQHGKVVEDCAWVSKQGLTTTEKGGSYKELNSSGQVRSCYLKPVAAKAPSNKAAYVEWAEANVPDFSVEAPCPTNGGKSWRLEDLKALYHSSKPAAAKAPDAQPEEDNWLTDWDQVDKDTDDLAHTTDCFFQAKKAATSDYHDNFNSYANFKLYKRTLLSFEEFLKWLQTKLDQQKADDVPVDERISSFDFYDFEKSQALRHLIVFQDNAAYNHGRDVRIKSLSKNDCADLLRQLFPEKTHIEVPNVEASRGSDVPVFDDYRIPAVGEKWQVGQPSAPELRVAVFDLVASEKPEMLAPPFQRLFKKAKNRDGTNWGLTEGPGVKVINTAPYVASLDWIPVEFKWARAKNWVANPASRPNGEPLTLSLSKASCIALIYLFMLFLEDLIIRMAQLYFSNIYFLFSQLNSNFPLFQLLLNE